MNNRVCERFDSLYNDFIDLTAEGKRVVVETAQSLWEAQMEIKLLLESIGIKAPPGAGKKE
jgi:hypothetical protein